MIKLLYVTCHPLTEKESKSLSIGRVFIEEWKKQNLNGIVEELNLYKEDIPILNAKIFDAWKKVKGGVKFYHLPKEEQEEMRQHDKLLNQFVSADKIVFVNPMWNHFMPSLMKQYIDILCVAGKTIKYTKDGPVGLLNDKKILHIQSAGGFYNHVSSNTEDYGHAYLKHIMEFLGIINQDEIFIDGIDAYPDKKDIILNKAKREARLIALEF